jgi:hypothetical protein
MAAKRPLISRSGKFGPHPKADIAAAIAEQSLSALLSVAPGDLTGGQTCTFSGYIYLGTISALVPASFSVVVKAKLVN